MKNYITNCRFLYNRLIMYSYPIVYQIFCYCLHIIDIPKYNKYIIYIHVYICYPFVKYPFCYHCYNYIKYTINEFFQLATKLNQSIFKIQPNIVLFITSRYILYNIYDFIYIYHESIYCSILQKCIPLFYHFFSNCWKRLIKR